MATIANDSVSTELGSLQKHSSLLNKDEFCEWVVVEVLLKLGTKDVPYYISMT